MAWEALTYSFGSKLTSTKMTQNQANFLAMAAGDSGAPSIVALGAALALDLTISNAAASPPDTNTVTKENIVKGWAHVTYSAGTPTLDDNFNVSGIVDIAVGRITIQWDTDFANATYAILGTGEDASGGCVVSIDGSAGLTVGDTDMRMLDNTLTLSDPRIVTFMAIGDQ